MDVPAATNNGDSQSGVKTGRVSKRHSRNHRSKSIVDPSASDMAVTLLKSEGQITITHPPCCDNGLLEQNLIALVPSPLNPQSSNPNNAEDCPRTLLWQQSPQNAGNANILPQQASLGFHPVNPVALPPDAVFHDRMMPGSYSHVNRPSGSPEPLQAFPYENIQKHFANQQSNEQTHRHTTGHAPSQQLNINSFGPAWPSQIHQGVTAGSAAKPADMLMVPLTHHEWLWIQHARGAGVNFADLPKSIAKTELRSSLESGPKRPPTSTSPKPQDSAKEVGGCCGKPATSPASTTSTTSTQPTPQPVNSPRCKCGDACRCVPCADHPFNPAMMETIKGDMQLIQEHASNSSKGPEAPGQQSVIEDPGSYEMELDENSPRTESISGDVNDFRDFVFYNYSYGGGCTEGRGGCMCGDGCTCVGCLTHGGHDGVPLNLGAVGDPGG